MIAGFLVLPSCYYVNQPVLPHQPYHLHCLLSQYQSNDICCVNLCHSVVLKMLIHLKVLLPKLLS